MNRAPIGPITTDCSLWLSLCLIWAASSRHQLTGVAVAAGGLAVFTVVVTPIRAASRWASGD
jgi:hypothetical protein